MNKKDVIKLLRQHCDPIGLNLIRVLSARRADEAMAGPIKTGHLLAGVSSIIMVGNYGPAMWEALQADIEADRERYDSLDDPVDVFTSRSMENAAEELAAKGATALAVYPWRQETSGFLPFQAWSIACGFGAMGLTGVVIHPTYGPWLSLRGAILTDIEMEPDRQLVDFDPCGKCAAPCFKACPGDAVSREGCDVQKCLRARLFDPACETCCTAREECVYGKEYRFSREEITYHSFSGIRKIRHMMGH